MKKLREVGLMLTNATSMPIAVWPSIQNRSLLLGPSHPQAPCMAALQMEESGERREREIPRGMGGRETLSEREAEADWTEVQTAESALQKLDIAASIFRSFPSLFS